MTFNANNDLEAGDPTVSFQAVIEQISNNLFKINNNINNTRKLQSTLVSRFNSTQSNSNVSNVSNVSSLQLRIVELISSTNELFKQLTEPKNSLISSFVYDPNSHGYSDNLIGGGYRDSDSEDGYKDNIYTNDGKVKLTRNQSLQKDKILREISLSLLAFQDTQQEFKEFIKQRELKQLLIQEEEQEAVSKAATSESSQVPQKQSQLIKELDPINNEELVYHTQMVNQREEEIQNIESSITELNTIFKDLDTLVADQGFMIDNIEDSLNSYNDNVHGADRQLTKANRSQRRSLKTKKCLILTCTIILIVLMLLVLALT